MSLSLLLEPGEYVILHGQRNLENVIKFKNFEIGYYAGLTKRTQSNHMYLYKQKTDEWVKDM